MRKLLKTFIREVLDGFSMAGSRRMEVPSNMRYDVAVRPGGSTDHVDQLMSMDSCPQCGAEPGFNIDCKTCMSLTEHSFAPTKVAACVLIMADDGKILAVSRKDNPSDLGLPGGKVDPGEQPIEAAARELTEETGLHIHDLKQVFSMHDGDSLCYTFVGKVSGEISTTESGVIKWVDPHVLLQGSFTEYNRAMLTQLGLL